MHHVSQCNSNALDKPSVFRDRRVVLRRIGHVLMIVAVLSATGMHWMILQSVAWTTMLAANLHSSSLSQAIEHTFDGNHPCCLCKAIAKGKQSEKKSDFQAEMKMLDFSHSNFEFVFCPPSAFRESRPVNESASPLTHSPAVPPPKEFLS